MIQYVYEVDVQEEDYNLSEELAWEEFHLLLRTLEEWYLLQKNQEDLNATQKTEDPRESKLSMCSRSGTVFFMILIFQINIFLFAISIGPWN